MKKKKNRASRRTSVRGACIIICASILFSIAFLLLRFLVSLTAGEQILLAFLETIVVLLLPAWIGLSGRGGLQIKAFHLAAVEPGKMALLFLTGLFVLFPMTLANEIAKTLLARFGIIPFRVEFTGDSFFFPSLLLYVLLRPISAALFYGEYLATSLGTRKLQYTQAVQIVLCTVQLGVYQGFLPALIVSVLFVLCFYQSSSVVASILFFSGYGFGEMVFDRLLSFGSSPSRGPLISAFLIVGTLVEVFWLNRVWGIPAQRERISLSGKLEFTKEERRLMIGTIVAVVAAIVVAEVLR